MATQRANSGLNHIYHPTNTAKPSPAQYTIYYPFMQGPYRIKLEYALHFHSRETAPGTDLTTP